MDPVSVGLLAALAGGAGGELGRQAWAGLTALVRRPFRRDAGEEAPAVSSGDAELARLEQDPADQQQAQALSTALAVRAALDTDFRTGLEAWQEQAKLVSTGDGTVHNTISGGTQHGPVLQGRDFSGLSFTTPPPAPSAPAVQPTADTDDGHSTLPPVRG
ncbi:MULTISPECIES: hypothetical protein [unclassified Streptomyces]|uniref:hypothetical protein n=1 Tax=unclassified Streptomyces TaxID=2593676 RepID=UPI0023660EF4|nr:MULTISPECIES: hypothetical protein [unclassified Streptomyces]MDF3143964.1 hypothetical protein [Streptomyces sp. T21Q-yed]WDF35712.1 hypothetical protein PBV52_02280 [Streptomyces sp. T12]